MIQAVAVQPQRQQVAAAPVIGSFIHGDVKQVLDLFTSYPPFQCLNSPHKDGHLGTSFNMLNSHRNKVQFLRNCA